MKNIFEIIEERIETNINRLKYHRLSYNYSDCIRVSGILEELTLIKTYLKEEGHKPQDKTGE